MDRVQLSATEVHALRSETASWTTRSAALVRLEECARVVRETEELEKLVQQSREIAGGLAKCINDLRSTLVRQACEAVVALAYTLKCEFAEAVGDAVMPALLKRAATRKSVMRDSARIAAHALLTHGAQGVSIRMAAYIAAAAVDKTVPAPVRAAAATYLGLLLEINGPALALQEELDRAIVFGCADATEEVRAGSRANLLLLLKADRQRALALRDRLPNKLKELMRTSPMVCRKVSRLGSSKPPIGPGIRKPPVAPRANVPSSSSSSQSVFAPPPVLGVKRGIPPARRRESREPGVRSREQATTVQARTRVANMGSALASAPKSRRSVAVPPRHTAPPSRRMVAAAAAPPRRSVAVPPSRRSVAAAPPRRSAPPSRRSVAVPPRTGPISAVRAAVVRPPLRGRSVSLQGGAKIEMGGEIQKETDVHAKKAVSKRPWKLTPPRGSTRAVRHSVAVGRVKENVFEKPVTPLKRSTSHESVCSVKKKCEADGESVERTRSFSDVVSGKVGAEETVGSSKRRVSIESSGSRRSAPIIPLNELGDEAPMSRASILKSKMLKVLMQSYGEEEISCTSNIVDEKSGDCRDQTIIGGSRIVVEESRRMSENGESSEDIKAISEHVGDCTGADESNRSSHAYSSSTHSSRGISVISSGGRSERFSVSPSQSITLVLNDNTQVLMTPEAKHGDNRKARLSYIIGTNMTPRAQPSDTCSETADMHDVLLRVTPKKPKLTDDSDGGSPSVVSSSKSRPKIATVDGQARTKLSAPRSLASSRGRSVDSSGSREGSVAGKGSSISNKSSALVRPRVSMGQENRGPSGSMARRPSFAAGAGLRDYNVASGRVVTPQLKEAAPASVKLMEALKLANSSSSSPWEQRLCAAKALVNGCRGVQEGDVDARMIEKVVRQLAKYTQDAHVRVVAQALDAAFELFLTTGHADALYGTLERRPELLRAVVACTADRREAARLAAVRVLHSFGVQFDGEQQLALLSRVHDGAARGARLSAECASVADVLRRTPDIAASARTIESLVVLVGKAMKAREMGVRKAATALREAMCHAFEERMLATACEKRGIHGALFCA